MQGAAVQDAQRDDDTLTVADCEEFFADRMTRTVAMDRPLLLSADGFRFPEPLRYHEHDLEQELDLVAITSDRRPARSGSSPRTHGSVPPSTAKPAW